MDRDDQIANALEDCRVRLRQGESVADCLARHPSFREELGPLLGLASDLGRLTDDPDPAFSQTASRRFHAQVDLARSVSRPTRASSRFGLGSFVRFLVPLAIVVLLFSSGFGLAQVSADALPDSPLYTVKQAQERFGRVLATTPSARVQYDLRLAGQRLTELDRAGTLQKSPALLESLATSMAASTTHGVGQIPQLEPSARAAATGVAHQLLPREERALGRMARSPNRQLAATAQTLLQQITADEKLVQ